MRQTALTLLLLAGCASGGNHDLDITILEAVTNSPTGVHATSVLGEHMLRLQIENRSHQEIVVHSIRLAPAGPDLWSDDPAQSIEQNLGPGQSQSFDLYLTVSTNSRSHAPTGQILESVSVDLSCTGSESGNFIAGGTYSVNHFRLGS